MLAMAMTYWRQTVRQSALWSTVLWTFVFGLILMILMLLLGLGSIGLAAVGLRTSTSFPASIGHLVGGLALMYLVILAAGPFYLAGVYGLVGQAVAGESVTWSSFWRLGVRFYGRGWGLIFFDFLVYLAVTLVGIGLFFAAHTVGIVVAVILFIAVLPVPLRMIGGLFVDVVPWGQSVRRALQWRGYGAIWGGSFLMLAASAILFLVVVGLFHVSAILGGLGYIVLLLAYAPLAAAWILSVYRAANGEPPSLRAA